ncbi:MULTISPECIES: pilus assembly protein [unclassified Marinobacter]|uniref:pilus assembly protein n=1 Tax=unclassified Marinobacter TaxID=83889 RepID=UPI0018F1C4DA|nr:MULTISPECIES: PilC/PilY family type IV pilus protein [unclassified Marinobacter]
MNTLNLKAMLAAILLVLPTAGYSARPDFAQEPLFIGSAVAPNLMFILDDSGSMEYAFMPDELSDEFADSNGYIGECKGGTFVWENRRFCATNIGSRAYLASSDVNKVYFNPNITYAAPAGTAGDVPFKKAPYDGYDTSSEKIDLSSEYRAIIDQYSWYYGYYDGRYYDDFTISPYGKAGAAFYYQQSSNCTSQFSSSCYSLVQPIPDAQKQNFANWFSYYRTRMMAAKAGIGEAFKNLPDNFRLGWGRINKGSSTVDGASVRAIVEGVRPYDFVHSDNASTVHKAKFYNWLYNRSGSGGTPLRQALEGAGDYYEGSRRAWADNPDASVSNTNPVRECRQAYTILMSDGYYNGSDPADAVKKADDKDGATITNNRGDSYKYVASNPFKDGVNDKTLADVAMHYWKRDLRTDSDMPNYVPNSQKNPAFWQHMVTYTVGLGVEGSVGPVAAFKALEDGTYINWWGGTSKQNKVNDMLHAAVNGRGGFFSASDPKTFADDLTGTVNDIIAEAGSSTAVEFDVSSFQQGALIFASQFDPNGWTGDLKAAKLGGTNSPIVPDINEAVKKGDGWSARSILDKRDLSADDRVIITYGNGAEGFRWGNLSNAQKNDLRYGSVGDTVAEQRLDYIRGDTSLDGTAGWRKRGSRLGSIVNSSPEFVGEPRAIWPDEAPFGTNAKRFSDFATNKKSRAPVVYTGSNDGMLHGFNGAVNGGDEVLAYIPGFVYNSTASNAGLHFLTDPAYQHRYYVDLEIRQQDIFTKGKKTDGSLTSDEAWRSIIVGGGRAGAKGIFALDVTDPSAFTEANAEKIILWEFAGTDDAKMGYVTQAPIIGMTKWGADERWTAFVSNGYNSATKSTGFFMLDIEGGMDGTWDSGDVRYVEFESATGTGPQPGGLSPLTALDTTGDYLVDRIYAGDLDGNVWVASLDKTKGTWAPTYKTGTTPSSPKPLFTTQSNQAITAAPVVAANKTMTRVGNMPNLMVYFGTGQYLESNDVTTNDKQSVYGIWDHGNSGLTTSNLESRSISEGNISGTNSAKVRYSTGKVMDFAAAQGWYVDLPTSGERAVVSPQIRGEFLYLNTMIPDQNPCLGGGNGWLMAFGLDGLTPTKKAFLKFGAKVAGYKSVGLPNQSTILGNYRFTPGSNNKDPVDVMEIPPLSGSTANAGRRGWNELVNE